MSLGLLTRGYLCPGKGVPGGIQIGPGPEIASVMEPAPEISRAQTDPLLVPEISALATDSEEYVPDIDHVQVTGEPAPEIDEVSTDDTVLVPEIKTVKTEDD